MARRRTILETATGVISGATKFYDCPLHGTMPLEKKMEKLKTSLGVRASIGTETTTVVRFAIEVIQAIQTFAPHYNQRRLAKLLAFQTVG